MRGSKEAVWAVVISAAIITAGLVLSCGDDDGGVSCKDVCNKLDECDMIPGGGDIADCVEGCEEDFDPADEGAKELMECIVDTDCDDLIGDCWCPIACVMVFDECAEPPWKTVSDCVDECAELWGMDEVFCVLEAEDCDDIEMCFD